MTNESAYLSTSDEETRTRLAQEHGRSLGEWYDPARQCWSVEATYRRCDGCWSWQRSPVAQRHLGFTWRRLCELRCACPCHTIDP